MICTFWTPFQAERDWQNYKIHTEELSKFHSNLFSLEIGLFTLHSAQLLCVMFIELPWDSTVAIKSFSYSRTFLFSLYFLQFSFCLCFYTFPLHDKSNCFNHNQVQFKNPIIKMTYKRCEPRRIAGCRKSTIHSWCLGKLA